MEDTDLDTQEAGAIKCEKCDKQFTRRANLKRHSEGCGAEAVLWCPLCYEDFTRSDNLERHLKSCSAEGSVKAVSQCDSCSKNSLDLRT
jgi:uncharacterized Zn-finger protein